MNSIVLLIKKGLAISSPVAMTFRNMAIRYSSIKIILAQNLNPINQRFKTLTFESVQYSLEQSVSLRIFVLIPTFLESLILNFNLVALLDFSHHVYVQMFFLSKLFWLLTKYYGYKRIGPGKHQSFPNSLFSNWSFRYKHRWFDGF